MWRSVLTFSIAGICIVIALAAAIYKHTQLSFPLTPDASINSWYVELHTTLQSPARWTNKYRTEEALVSVISPASSDGYAVVDKHITAREFGKQTAKVDGNRVISFSKREPDNTESIYVRFLLYELDVDDTAHVKESYGEELSSNEFSQRNRVKSPDEMLSVVYQAIDDVTSVSRQKSSSAKTFTMELWKTLRDQKENVEHIRNYTKLESTRELMLMLLRADGVTARLAHGLKLEKTTMRSAQLMEWIEVYYKDSWRQFNAETGEFVSEDKPYYRWWTGETPLVETAFFSNKVTNISIKPNSDSSLTRALWQAREKQPLAYRLALQNLPLDQQLVMQVLLLMPLGALLVSFLRQVIGVKTFGTFMPVLVALAFRETGLGFGIIFFSTLIFVGLTLRSYLKNLQLLLVPRLSTVLTVVVMLIMFGMIGFKDSDIPLGVSVALFPVVIVTMFIERMSLVWEERGAKSALIACIGSLLVSCLVYLVMINPIVKHALFTFPELLLVIFGCCLMLGRYNGYKLTEYYRFRELRRAMKEA
jgi:7 transmembrane helices usually fused to an inactive transglutaminase/Inactive transglutaminase fused to 7 transmembrane helices